MNDEILRIREAMTSIQGAMEQFTSGNRDQLFEARDVLRELGDRVGSSAWRYSAPICEAVQRLLGNVLRHGGLTEEDSIVLASELLQFVNGLLDMPAPGLCAPQIVRGAEGAAATAAGVKLGSELAYKAKGEPIKLSLGMADESRLGEILVGMDALTSDQLNQALALQQVCRKRLGEVLVSMNLIDDATLEQALDRQRLITLQMAGSLAGGTGGLELSLGAPPQPKPA
jgi:hypothetical protein